MSETTTFNVAAIIVSHNTCELLLNCIRALKSLPADETPAEIIVVDTESQDGSAEAVRRCFPDVTVLEVSNRGYGAAANAGAEASRAPYLLILNADTEVRPGAIAKLQNVLSADPSLGLAGPRLLFPDGTVQSSRRRFPTALTPFFESTLIEQSWPDNRWARAYHMRNEPERPVQPVDWFVGAALMVKREAFEQVGGFDPAFRMFSEEIDLAHRMRRHGWRAVFVRDAEVIHHEGASTSQNVPRRQAEFDASRVLLQRRVHGRFAAAALAVALRTGYLVQIALEGAKWLIGHRRDLRAARVRIYAGLLLKRWEAGG